MTDKIFNQQIGGLKITIQKKRTNEYVCKIDGFNTESSAKEYLKRFWVGLVWVMLNYDLAFSVSLDLDVVTDAEDPKIAAQSLNKNFGLKIEQVDGLISEGHSAVYPSDKIIRVLSASANFSVITPVEKIYLTLMKGINDFNSVEVFKNSKLKTAIDLYNANFYEYSLKSKFLTLIMALEVLSNGRPKSQIALVFLEKWKNEIFYAKSKFKKDDKDFESLESLERELIFRKENSLRSRIRELVYESLKDANNHKAGSYAKMAVKLYDKRSTLVHEGSLPDKILEDSFSELKELVKLILNIKLTKIAMKKTI